MSDIKTIDEIVTITRQIKDLEANKKKLTDALKAQMINENVDIVTSSDGAKIQLVHSSRNSVKKNMKDSFMLFLKQNNLTSCLKISPEIDFEILETQINTGNVSKQDVEKYVNFTNVVSMRVNA